MFVLGGLLALFVVRMTVQIKPQGPCCSWLNFIFIVVGSVSYLSLIFGEEFYLPWVWALVIAKMCTVAIRFVLVQNLCHIDDGHMDLANLILFAIEFGASVAVRSKVGLDVMSGSELVHTTIVSVGICFIEAVMYSVSCWLNVVKSHSDIFKGLNTKTLSGVLEAYQMYQRQMQVFYGHLLVGELTETTACVLLAIYEVVMPEFSQEGSWYALADLHGARRFIAAAKLVIRLGIQVC